MVPTYLLQLSYYLNISHLRAVKKYFLFYFRSKLFPELMLVTIQFDNSIVTIAVTYILLPIRLYTLGRTRKGPRRFL